MRTFFILLLFIGCIREERLRLATTTSLENSGILKVLLKEFEKTHKIKVDVIAVGTGAALRLGRNGDCDILLVHSKKDEEEFVKDGFGINRQEIMWNDFVLLGPRDDPAKIKGKDLISGLKNIAKEKEIFVSRGDDSGTHKKEKGLWEKTGIKPKGKWYLETGQGMGETLIIANEKNGYCLSDRGTYLSYKNKISLVILKEDPKELYNPYSVIIINPKKYPINYGSARKLADWLIKQECQRIIGEYRVNGIRLFNPINEPFHPISSYITTPLEKARSIKDKYNQMYESP
ncbi:MAG: substrate-binding domain-containing protein [bacterium]